MERKEERYDREADKKGMKMQSASAEGEGVRRDGKEDVYKRMEVKEKK